MLSIDLLKVKRGIHNPTRTGAFNLSLKASNDGKQTISLWNLLQPENSVNSSLLCSQWETENNRSSFCLQKQLSHTVNESPQFLLITYVIWKKTTIKESARVFVYIFLKTQLPKENF